ncbi:MAG: hypothetical protein M0T73_16810 [Deltaproteobacteria bacterium]|nr:hypothetical protein [Deltaproteobacteria bacterium]
MMLSWVVLPYNSSGSVVDQRLTFSWLDAVALCGFALFAAATFLGRWKGITPFVFLSSDAGIVSSFVAAYQHPELFRGDVLLGDFTNFRYYLAIHPLLILVINKLTGDYGLAYISLLLITVFVQCCGFYLLGLTLFRSRYWALLLVVINLAPIALPVREFWGIYDDPLPRSLFHACLPFLLAAAFRFKYEVRVWPWIMVATGLIFYTHPVSAPPWALAIWLGFWIFLPPKWGILKKFAYMFMLGLIFVVTVIPWALNLVLVHERPASAAVNYNDVVGIIADRVGAELLDVGLALTLWLKEVSSWPLWLFCLWSVTGSVVLWSRRRDLRADIKLVAVWCLGIIFVAVGLTFVEQTICRIYDLKRFQMDSIRGVKYLVPIMLLMCVWSLAGISRQFRKGSLSRISTMVLGALITVIWVYHGPPVTFIQTAKAWAHGSLTPRPSKDEVDTVQAVNAMKENTKPGSTILSLVLPLEVRYAALRPIAYAYKDGGIFADTNLGSLLEWDKIRKSIDEINSSSNLGSKLLMTLELAKRLNTDYVMTDFNVVPDMASSLGAKVVWSNKSYTLLSLNPEMGSGG